MDRLHLRPPKVEGLEPRDVEELTKGARRDYYARTKSSLFAFPVIVWLTGWASGAASVHTEAYIAFGVGMTAVAVVRWVLCDQVDDARESRSMLVFNALASVSSFAMGLAVALLLVEDGLVFATCLALITLACFCAVTAIFISMHLFQVQLMLLAAHVPYVLLLLEPNRESLTLVAAAVAFVATLMTMARRSHGWQWEARIKAQQLRATARRQTKLSRLVGRSEVATGILHDVGNVLNSVKTSMQTATGRVEQMPTDDLHGVSELLAAHEGKLGDFFARDPRAAAVPSFLRELAEQIVALRSEVGLELARARRHLDHVEVIIQRQQEHARPTVEAEDIDLDDLLREAVDFIDGDGRLDGVVVTMQTEGERSIQADRHRVLQILVNLVKNAVEASEGARQPRVALRAYRVDARRVALTVEDNGKGVGELDQERMFARGFTTKSHGHGFGLHGSRLLARALGGDLTFSSDGPGKGARFVLTLPSAAEANAA